MKDIQNYTIRFMGDFEKNITKEQAEQLLLAWNSGAKFILIGGEVFATHQILSITSRPEFRGCYNIHDDLIKKGYLKENTYGDWEKHNNEYRKMLELLTINPEKLNCKLLN